VTDAERIELAARRAAADLANRARQSNDRGGRRAAGLAAAALGFRLFADEMLRQKTEAPE